MKRQQTSSADRASEGVKRPRAASSVLLATQPFALFLRSWRPIFATSFGPAPLTVIDPRYSAHERVEGVERCSERWGVWPDTRHQAAPSEDAGVARWRVYIENAIDSALQLWRALPTHSRGEAEAARHRQIGALIPDDAPTNEQGSLCFLAFHPEGRSARCSFVAALSGIKPISLWSLAAPASPPA